ncbi:MAG: ATP synthase F0 subunit B [bacterium]|nr:ATP synthase F0 subunit B [bacterium]
MEQLGIDWRLFLLQLLNFGIIFVLLVALLRQPLAKVLRERSDRIEQSLKEAAKIKLELTSIEERKERELARAKADSQELLKHSQTVAQEIEKKAQADARAHALELIEQAKQEITAQKERLTIELKDDLAVLVKESIAHSLESLTAEEQRSLVDRAIVELNKQSSTKHANS